MANWSIPVNLGQPLNTPERDDYFTIGGSVKSVAFHAMAPATKNSDLYEVEIPAEEMRPKPTVVVGKELSPTKKPNRWWEAM